MVCEISAVYLYKKAGRYSSKPHTQSVLSHKLKLYKMTQSKKAAKAVKAIETPVVSNELKAAVTEAAELIVVNNATAKAAKEPVAPELLEQVQSLKLNTVNTIKTLYANGASRQQIIASGFNSSTVHRQVLEYVKAQNLAEAKALLLQTTEPVIID